MVMIMKHKAALMMMKSSGEGMILIILMVTIGKDVMTPTANHIITKTAGQQEIFSPAILASRLKRGITTGSPLLLVIYLLPNRWMMWILKY